MQANQSQSPYPQPLPLSNSHTSSQYFPCLKSTKAKFQTARDSLYVRKPAGIIQTS